VGRELLPLAHGLQRELGVVEPSTRLGQLARRGGEFAFELSNRRLGCDRLETALDQLDERLGEAETALSRVDAPGARMYRASNVRWLR